VSAIKVALLEPPFRCASVTDLPDGEAVDADRKRVTRGVTGMLDRRAESSEYISLSIFQDIILT